MILRTSRAVLGGVSRPLTVQPACIEIVDGRIAAITDDPPMDAEVMDLGDWLVTPGFINTHTHLPMSAFRGIGGLTAMRGNVVEQLFYTIEKDLQPADVRAFARMGAYEALLTGTTCVWEHYYHGEALAEAIYDVGITAVVSPTLQDLSGPGSTWTQDALDATAAIVENSQWADAGVVAGLGPHATDTVSDRLWQEVSERATHWDLPIHFHLAQSLEEYQRSLQRHECSPVLRLKQLGLLSQDHPLLMVHALFVSEEDLDLLDPARHVMGHCPWSQMRFGFPGDVDGWTHRGLQIAVGTDCGACNDTMNVQQELRLLSCSRAAVPTWSDAGAEFRRHPSLQTAQRLQDTRQEHYEQRAWSEPRALLASVWSVPGQLHPVLRQGALEKGHEANLVVWDPDHPACWPLLDPLHNLCACNMAPALLNMMVRGRWLGETGAFRASVIESDEYREAAAEATDRLQLLLERLGLT